MTPRFEAVDWIVFFLYISALAGIGWFFSRQKSQNTRDYFLGGNRTPSWVAAISILATQQSAATFLGGPDQGYRGDFTYVTTFVGVLLAAIFVSKLIIKRFYAARVTTVYELLALKYGDRAMHATGTAYLIGGIFDGGARVFIAAIAVSMILYGNVDAQNVILSALFLVIFAFLISFIGGIRAVVWSDVIQAFVYIFSAVAVTAFLISAIPATPGEVIEALSNAPDGQNKLMFISTELDFSHPYSAFAILTGIFLLYVGNFGLDQNITQRILTCRDSNSGSRATVLSVFLAVPVVFMFILIGQLLHVFYERPDLMGDPSVQTSFGEFEGEKVTVFMHYILTQIPTGLRGLIAVGVIAATISTVNSFMNAMSSVLVQNFYRGWKIKRSLPRELHFVNMGRVGMACVGSALFLMAVFSLYWQRYTEMPLLDFALSVMVFTYSGLLGVFFSALFSGRGSSNSVIWALVAGFLATFVQQEYVVDALHLPSALKGFAFPWQLCISTGIAFSVCQLGSRLSGKVVKKAVWQTGGGE